MDYEKKYKEALAKAKEQYNYPTMSSCMSILEEIFPELQESEDERIRGAIIDHLKDNNLIEWAAWLEKQSKASKVEEAMKEVEEKAKAFTAAHQGENADEILAEMRGEGWSEEDESMRRYVVNDLVKRTFNNPNYMLKMLKRKTWKPSDEQIRALEYIIDNTSNVSFSCNIIKGLLEQLKKLKENKL